MDVPTVLAITARSSMLLLVRCDSERLLVTAIDRFWGILNQARLRGNCTLPQCHHPANSWRVLWTRQASKRKWKTMASLRTSDAVDTSESPVQAIIFDAFGTIVDWRGSLISSLKSFGRERGLEAPWEKVADSWRAAYQPNLDRVRRGELEWTILDELHYGALGALLPKFAIASLPESDLRFLTSCWHRLSAWPDAIAGLRRLKKK